MAPTTRSLRRVRWAVRAVLVLGIAASVAANVLHAQPDPIAQCIAAWPPVALLLTVELIARVPVHRRRLAAVRLAATTLIAAVAAWVSYWHMAGVAARYGENGAAPYLLPLSVDGLIVITSVCLVELAGRIRADGLLPTEEVAEEIKASAAEPMSPQVSLVKIRPNPSTPTDPDSTPTGPTVDPGRARRAAALAAIALGDDLDDVAAAAGVTPRTVQRWADDAARLARAPRGGRRAEADLVSAGARES